VLEEEIGQLKARMTALEAGHISSSASPPVRATVLADLVHQRSGVHPSKRPRKEKKEKTEKKEDMLKTALHGHCLTAPELIAALKEQEAEQQKKEDAKQRRKDEVAAATKQSRLEAAAATRKRKAEDKSAEKQGSKRSKTGTAMTEVAEEGGVGVVGEAVVKGGGRERGGVDGGVEGGGVEEGAMMEEAVLVAEGSVAEREEVKGDVVVMGRGYRKRKQRVRE
jgi:hypothetical protein